MRAFFIGMILVLGMAGCAESAILPGETHVASKLERSEGSTTGTKERLIRIVPATQPAAMPLPVRLFDPEPDAGVASSAPASITVGKDGAVSVTGIAPGMGVEIQERGDWHNVEPVVARTDTADAKGVGVTSAGGDGVKVGSENQPSKAGVAPIRSDGGGGGMKTEAGGSVTTSEASGANWPVLMLYGMGGLCVVTGTVVLIWLRWIWFGLGFMGAGVAVLACAALVDKAPWVFPLCVGLLVVSGFLAFLFLGGKFKKTDQALVAAVAGVEDFVATNPASGETVKARVAKRAGGAINTVRAVIRQAKEKAGVA